MSQKRSKQLQPAHDFFKRRERAAAEAFSSAKSKQQAATDQLADLQNYRNDYQRRLQAMGSSGIPVMYLQHFNAFMGQLDKAIEQQRSVVDIETKKLGVSKQHWVDEYRNERGMDTVVKKFVAEEAKDAERREQKATDELRRRPGAAPAA